MQTMKHALFAAGLLALTLSACGQKDAAVVAPPQPVIAEPSPAVTVPATPTVTAVEAANPAANPAGNVGSPAPDANAKSK
jgi:hypothetical protein